MPLFPSLDLYIQAISKSFTLVSSISFKKENLVELLFPLLLIQFSKFRPASSTFILSVLNSSFLLIFA